jgi:2-polyprenyl-6-methoxyphenol hydroxylase-like FAD-dependent oxidoreductase
MIQRDAIVVGAGIGGLAGAAGLARAGWRVTVLERVPQLAPVGAGITVSPNAVRALEWLGLGARLRQHAAAQGAAGLRTPSGRWLMHTDIEALADRYGTAAYALHRAELHGMLLDAAGAADIRLGHRVRAVRQDADAVQIDYESGHGAGTLHAKLVVAADGLHSTLRSALLPGHSGVTPAGYTTWRAVVDADAAESVTRQRSVTETWGRGQRFGIVPLADGRVYWFATGVGGAAPLSTVAARFAGWHPPIPQLLAATRPDALLQHRIEYLRDPLPGYVHGRVALLGDAAHAITPDLGQGGALALEDATVLATELGAASDVPAALARYDAARRERTQHLVRASAAVGRVAQWRNPLAAGIRDTLLAAAPTRLYLNGSADTFAWTPPRDTEPTR